MLNTQEFKSTRDALVYIYNLSLQQSAFMFRGQARFEWSLLPSIHRYSGLKRYQTVRHEGFLISQKPTQPVPPLTQTTHDLEWLMICQHYGVPTRLLDWSNDILIALFFACSDNANLDSDGSVFICNRLDYPTYSFKESLKEEQSLSFASTSITNPRMRTQSGAFMIWGLAPLSDKSKESYDLWKYQNDTEGSFFLEKVLIPKHSKKKIINELAEVYSISAESIFLNNSYIEKNYGKKFIALKEELRLMTLYQTDADKLTQNEETKARKLFKLDCRNMFHETVSLSKY